MNKWIYQTKANPANNKIPNIEMIIPVLAMSFIETYLVEKAIAVGGVPKGKTKSNETPMAAATTTLVIEELNEEARATTIGR